MLAVKLQDCNADFITWVPVSGLRRFERGYDHGCSSYVGMVAILFSTVPNWQLYLYDGTFSGTFWK